MKKSIKIFMGLIAGVLLSFATSSCSKVEINENNIEGKWQSTSASYKVYEADKLVSEESEACIDWYLGFYFKSDGTGQVVNYENGKPDTYKMTWVIMGEKLMVKLNFGEESETVTYDIVEIKSDSMALSETYEYTLNGVQCKEVETYYFNKI